jgi:hypothetical protein
MACKITSGRTNTCPLPAGGLKSYIYIGNLADVVEFTRAVDGSVTAIDFVTGAEFYKIEGGKSFADITDDIARATGAPPNFPQTLIARLPETTQSDKKFINDLANADALFAIVERSNKIFEVIGIELGLQVATAPRASGADNTADSRRVVTLSGNETEVPPTFFVTSYAVTKALLETYLLPAV